MEVSNKVIEDVYHALLDLQIEEMEYEFPGIISYPGLRELMKERYKEGKLQVKNSITSATQAVKVMKKEGFADKIYERNLVQLCMKACNKRKSVARRCLISSKRSERNLYPSKYEKDLYFSRCEKDLYPPRFKSNFIKIPKRHGDNLAICLPYLVYKG